MKSRNARSRSGQNMALPKTALNCNDVRCEQLHSIVESETGQHCEIDLIAMEAIKAMGAMGAMGGYGGIWRDMAGYGRYGEI